MKRWLFACMVLPATAVADTVYLKNGEWIDGKVSLKTSTVIELQIGDIGKIELAVEDIHSIEKNNRTGGRSLESYVEPKGKTEKLGAGKTAAKTDKKTEAPAKDAGADSTKTATAEKVERKPVDPKSSDASEEKEESGSKGAKGGDDEKGAKSELDPELKARIEELVREIQRDKARNRVQAERHLEAIGQPAIPFLIPIARNPNDLTRIAVMRLFHSFGDHQVVEPAIEGLLDDNEYVRDYANKSLKRITGEDFGYQPSASPRRREVAQRKWLDWWDKEKKAMADERKLSEKTGR